MQLAAMGITMAIGFGTGAIGGWIASRLPFPEHFFDDSDHFDQVDFAEDTAEFNLHLHGDSKPYYGENVEKQVVEIELNGKSVEIN